MTVWTTPIMMASRSRRSTPEAASESTKGPELLLQNLLELHRLGSALFINKKSSCHRFPVFW
jgi:hypothetical protein